jgi:hypothetical protein
VLCQFKTGYVMLSGCLLDKVIQDKESLVQCRTC